MTSHIRIPDVAPVAQAMADGARTVFSFPFPIFADAPANGVRVEAP